MGQAGLLLARFRKVPESLERGGWQGGQESIPILMLGPVVQRTPAEVS